MLEGLYESVLWDLLKKDLEKAPSSEITKAKKKAGAKFAEEIMRNPNFNRVANRSWFGRVRLWLRRRIVTTDFESLDTREFIEQLANTEAGDKLAKLTKPEPERALRTIAYQFERYGEAASDYFARRAGVLSVFIALALALIVNIDAVRTFRTLVLKPVVAQKLVEAMNVLEKAKPQQPQAKKGPTPTPGPDADAEASETNKTADQDAASAIDRVNQELAKLSAQGLPVGRAYFPFCYTYIDADISTPRKQARRKLTQAVRRKLRLGSTWRPAKTSLSVNNMRECGRISGFYGTSSPAPPTGWYTSRAGFFGLSRTQKVGAGSWPPCLPAV